MSAIAVPPHVKLCSALTLDYPSEISSLNLKSKLYKVAAIVCAIAITIILFSSSLVCLGLLDPPATWVLLASLLATVAAYKGLEIFWKNGIAANQESASLTKIVAKMAELENWGEAKISEYLNERHLSLPKGDILNSLDQIHPRNHLKALLPLIAREKVLEEEATELIKRSRGAQKALKKNTMIGELENLFVQQIFKDRYELAVNTIQRSICLQHLEMPDYEFEIITTDNGQLISGKSKNNENNEKSGYFGKLNYEEFDCLLRSYRPEAEGNAADDDHSRNFFLRREFGSEEKDLSLDDFLVDLDVPSDNDEYMPVPSRILPICLPEKNQSQVLTPADIRTEIFG